MNVRTKFEVGRFVRSSGNSSDLKTLGCPCIRPLSLFSKNINGLLFGWTYRNIPAMLEVVTLSVPGITGTSKNLGQSLKTPFKVIQGRWFWYQSKPRIWLPIVVRNYSNLGPITHSFGDIAGFLSSWVTPPLFHLNFWGVSVAPDGPFWGQPEQRP